MMQKNFIGFRTRSQPLRRQFLRFSTSSPQIEVKQQEFKLPIAENKPNQTTTILNTASHDNHEFLLKPKIVLVGIGGGGGSTINNMIKRKLTGVEFVLCNTNAQMLATRSETLRAIQLGKQVSKGLGTGANPLLGRQAAEESLEEVMECIGDCHLVFITAGLGGGTGTGAAPVIAEACKKKGILTVAVVTTPFEFEGNRRMKIAQKGVEELEKVVDVLIVVSNQKLLKYEKTLTYVRSFEIVDETIYKCIESLMYLMSRPGLINLDFADMKSVMESTGRALIGTGEAEGKERAMIATEKALCHPLLDDVTMNGAKSVLLHIAGGPDCTLFEVKQVSEIIRQMTDPDANIIFGTALSEEMLGKIRVSLLVCGLQPKLPEPKQPLKPSFDLWEFIKRHW